MIEEGGLRIAIFYPRSSIFEYQNLITVAPQTHRRRRLYSDRPWVRANQID